MFYLPESQFSYHLINLNQSLAGDSVGKMLALQTQKSEVWILKTHIKAGHQGNICNPRIGGLEEGDSWETHQQTRLATEQISNFNKRPCLKIQHGEQLRKISYITLWPPHKHKWISILTPTHVHTREHTHTHTEEGGGRRRGRQEERDRGGGEGERDSFVSTIVRWACLFPGPMCQ